MFVPVGEGVPVVDSVPVPVGDTDLVGDGVEVGETEGKPLVDGELVGVTVPDAVAVRDEDGVTEPVVDGDAVDVRDEVGVAVIETCAFAMVRYALRTGKVPPAATVPHNTSSKSSPAQGLAMRRPLVPLAALPE